MSSLTWCLNCGLRPYFRHYFNLCIIETGMVEAIISKVIAWEKERGLEFLYDGVSILTNIYENFIKFYCDRPLLENYVQYCIAFGTKSISHGVRLISYNALIFVSWICV